MQEIIFHNTKVQTISEHNDLLNIWASHVPIVHPCQVFSQLVHSLYYIIISWVYMISPMVPVSLIIYNDINTCSIYCANIFPLIQKKRNWCIVFNLTVCLIHIDMVTLCSYEIKRKFATMQSQTVPSQYPTGSRQSFPDRQSKEW